MPRALAGLLAAVGAAVARMIELAHGDLAWLAVSGAATAAGVLAYVTAPIKKNSLGVTIVLVRTTTELTCARDLDA
jgi:hypothetical protein